MKKGIKRAFVGFSALVLLSGCALPTKYDKFKEKVDAAEKAPEVEKAIIKGKTDSKSFEFDLKDAKATLSNLDITAVYSTYAVAIETYAAKETEGVKYYAFTSFKVVDGEKKIEWDKYKSLTKVQTEDIEFKVTYTYKK